MTPQEEAAVIERVVKRLYFEANLVAHKDPGTSRWYIDVASTVQWAAGKAEIGTGQVAA